MMNDAQTGQVNRVIKALDAALWSHKIDASTDKLIECCKKKIELLEKLKIAVACEKSAKNYISVLKLNNKTFIFEHDLHVTQYTFKVLSLSL